MIVAVVNDINIAVARYSQSKLPTLTVTHSRTRIKDYSPLNSEGAGWSASVETYLQAEAFL